MKPILAIITAAALVCLPFARMLSGWTQPAALTIAAIAAAVGLCQTLRLLKMGLGFGQHNLFNQMEGLFCTLGGGMALIDRSRRIVYYDRSLESMFGPLAENKHKPCYKVFCGLDAACTGCTADACFAGVAPACSSREGVVITKTGELRHMRFLAMPVRSPFGGIRYVLEAFEDITPKKHVEKNLDQRNLQVSTINEVAGILCNSLDLDQTLPCALDVLVRNLGFDAGCVYVLDDTTHRRRMAAACELPADVAEQTATLADDDPLRRLAAKGANGCTAFGREDLARSPVPRAWLAAGISSGWLMDLRSDGQTSGIVCLLSKAESAPDIEQFCVALKAHFNAALNNSLLFKRLQKSERTYRHMFNSSPDAIKVVDLSFVILDANAECNRTYGYMPEELIGTSALMLVAEQDRKVVVASRAKVLAGQRTVVEVEVIAKDGRRVPVELSITLIEYRGRAAALVAARDISARRQTERTVRSLTELNRQIVENASIGIMTLDENLVVTSYNRFLQEEYGHPPKEVLGKPVLDAIPALRYEGFEEIAREVLATGQTLKIDLARHLTVLRGWREMNVKLVPLQLPWRDGRELVIFVDDVTEQMRMMREIAAGKTFFEGLVENANVLMAAIGSDLTPTLWNRCAERVLGYSRAEVIGNTGIFERILPNADCRKMVLDKVLRISGAGENVELSMMTRDGRERVILWSVVKQYDERGGDAGRFAVGVDVTQRKRLQEKVLSEREQLFSILNNLDECVVLEDRAGRVIFMNNAAVTSFGRQADNFLGQAFAAMPMQSCPLEPGIAKQERTWHFEATGRNGRFYELTVTSVRSPSRGMRLLEVARDVTEWKAADRERRVAARFFRKVSEALIATDGSFSITAWNPGAEAMLGYTAEEIIGKHVAILLRPEDQPEAFDVVIRVLAEAGVVQDHVTMVRKDGQPLRVLRSISPIFDEHGNIDSYVGVLKDITEFQNMQQQLFQAQKMESIGTLAGGIAHDFNNVLSVVLGHASFLKQSIPPDSPLHTDVERIESSAKRAAGLTKQLLSFARGGAAQPRVLDINTLVAETLEMLSRTIGRNIVISRNLEPHVWSVEADRVQMQQVLTNLSLNARDAMPDGGELTVQTANLELGQRAARRIFYSAKPGRYVRISVADTGIGMDEDTRQRAFEPFFSKKGGTGLGLSMVYGIIHNHGGFIGVESELGKGSTFSIYLPAREEAPGAEEQAAEEIERGRGTVLAVDDEEVVLEVVGRMLESMGYNVLKATSGEAAIHLYSSRKDEVDLVILDIIMPGVPGMEIFESMKAVNPEVKVLLSSGYPRSEAAAEAVRNGAMGFLEKPYDMGELSAAVRRAIAEGREKQPAQA